MTCKNVWRQMVPSLGQGEDAAHGVREAAESAASVADCFDVTLLEPHVYNSCTRSH